MYDAILVGTDGSDSATKAVDHAGALAEALGVPLHIVSAYDADPVMVVAAVDAPVAEASEWIVGALAEVEHVLQAAAGRFDGRPVVVTTHLRAGDPVNAILETAVDAGADLIVVGNRGMHGRGRLLGSIPNSVAHKAHCHVLIVETV
jgi:nucleotide-binding universal stress UspA family protein